MTTPSLHDLRGQLESIDACLRKYVRLRAQLIEIIAFMEDEKEQEHLRAIRERSRTGGSVPEVEPQDPAKVFGNGARPKMPAPPAEEAVAVPPVRRPNPLSTTLSMEA